MRTASDEELSVKPSDTRVISSSINNKKISIMWIPEDCNIQGNEKAHKSS